MRPYDIVLLDADMTLFDFDRSEREGLRRTLEQYSMPFSPEIYETYRKINSALWESFFKGKVDQDFLVVERFAALQRLYGGDCPPQELNRTYERCLGEEAHLLPGAADFCQALKELGLTLAIATNGMPVAQRGRYTRTGLDKLIPHLFISMELGVQKPLPAYFDRVFEALGVTDRSRAVMVGDSLTSDIQGGSNAGIDTIWYNPSHKPLTGYVRPTYTVSGYDEILRILSQNIPQKFT